MIDSRPADLEKILCFFLLIKIALLLLTDDQIAFDLCIHYWNLVSYLGHNDGVEFGPSTNVKNYLVCGLPSISLELQIVWQIMCKIK